MARVKICGIKSKDIIDVAIEARAEMIGLVLFPKSPRNVSITDAAALAAHARAQSRDDTSVVVLMVDPPDDQVRAAIDAIAPDFLQLHGHETPERVKAIGMIAQKPIIKAISVATAADTLAADAFAGKIWITLFDAKPPAAAAIPGGNGIAFDWHLLKAARERAPFMLSGGLNPTNVRDAIRIADPLYVDVSSGVETAPGAKDPDLIRAFTKAAHGLSDR